MRGKNTTTKKKAVAKVAPRYGKRCLAKGIYVTNDVSTHIA